jgi:hypothetical protein
VSECTRFPQAYPFLSVSNRIRFYLHLKPNIAYYGCLDTFVPVVPLTIIVSTRIHGYQISVGALVAQVHA